MSPTALAVILLFGFCGIVLAVRPLMAASRRRRELAQQADKAIVAGLAKGVRVGRNLSRKAADYQRRVIDEANKPEQ